MASRWPTELDGDGTAPVNLVLAGSDDQHLSRQAIYQVIAGAQLQERGFAIDAFQLPLVGKMVRITIPIAATMADGRPAAIYTQSEAWTPDRIADLRTWIANLREESAVAVVVVASRFPPPAAASAPEVATWLHLPFDELDQPAAAAAPAPQTGALPLLPCLKERKWPGREDTVCRALWEKETSRFMPWVAVGYDHPHTFEFINTNRLPELNTTEDALHAQALQNLCARPAKWEPVDVDAGGTKLQMLVNSSDYFAAEHILDAAFMREAQRTLKTHGLFVGVPRRGILMASAAGQDDQMLAGFAAAVAGQFKRGETAVISPSVFAMKDGAIVGIFDVVADAVVPDGEPAGAPAEERDDDPNAPYVSAMVSRNDRGTEDVHLMAGAQDGERLAKAIEVGFMSLLKEHMARAEFSGHIQIVVLGMTPPAARKPIPNLLEHLRGICNEVSRGSERRYRVTLTFQKDSLQPSSGADAAMSTSAPAAAVAASKPRPPWKRPMRWVMALVGAVVAYFAIARQQSQAYPATIDFGSAALSQANTWNRGDISGAVYVPAGEALPRASLQVGLVVSTEHPSGNDLLTWIREQSLKSGTQRHHDSGTPSETCVVGVTGARTYMALQLCNAANARAACIESDRELDGGVFASCLNQSGCFDAACKRRWLDEREHLDRVLARVLARPR